MVLGSILPDSGRFPWECQHHLAGFAGKEISLAEVGVQSGGSLLMWKSVLGAEIKLLGLDINPKCEKSYLGTMRPRPHLVL